LLLDLFTPAAYADGGAPQLAYVAGTSQGISIIDIAQRRVTGTVALVGRPRSVLLSPDGQALYVTRPDAGQVAVVTAKTGRLRCTADLPGQPSLLALSLDATVLYAAGQGDTRVRALDPATCAVRLTFETQQPVYGMAVAASTALNATPSTPNQLWIAGTTALTVFDATGSLLGIVPVAGGPQNISIPSGFTAYVTTRQHTLVAIDLNTHTLLRTLLSGGDFGSMDFDETTGEIYVPDRQHDQLDVLTPVTINTTVMPQEPTRVLHLNGSPQAVAITNDGQLGFVALASGQVTMLDIPARSIVATIAVGGTPRFIITGLYPPTSNNSTPAQTSVSPSSKNVSTLALLLLALTASLLLGGLWFLWRWRSVVRKRL
jgi:DNA-binding beta-propeller fold protein YncE